MSKTRAFLIHLSISAAVVGVALALVFFVWYPSPYFQIAGTWNVLRILIAVDLVVGPLMTLMLFRSGKPGLVFDLSVIAAIQIAALVYGTTVIYSERPYFVVFSIDRFEVLARKDVDEAAITDARLKQKSWSEPIYVVASLPDSFEEQQRLIDEVLQGKPDIERRPEYWSPYAEKSDIVLEKATPIAEFGRARPDAAEFARRIIETHEQGDRLSGVPVIGKRGAYLMVIEPEQKKPVGLIPVDPWVAPTDAVPRGG